VSVVTVVVKTLTKTGSGRKKSFSHMRSTDRVSGTDRVATAMSERWRGGAL